METSNKQFINVEITGKIIGCAMRVHNEIGNGFPEYIYGRCLEIEFSQLGISYKKELSRAVYYKGIEVGIRRVDFLIEENILLEIKALSNLDSSHLFQAINYLQAFRLETGLLINFGGKRLEYKRVINTLK